MKYKVTKKSQRPANMNGKCFYCHQAIGDYHKDDCVLINKPIRLKLTIEYDVNVPSSWEKRNIEFHYNDGCWCGDNIPDDIEKYITKINQDGKCLCNDYGIECIDENKEKKGEYIKE